MKQTRSEPGEKVRRAPRRPQIYFLAHLGSAGLFSHVYAVTPLELQGRVHALFTLVGGLGAIAAPLLAGLAVAQDSQLLFAGLVLGAALVGYGLLLASRQVRELP